MPILIAVFILFCFTTAVFAENAEKNAQIRAAKIKSKTETGSPEAKEIIVDMSGEKRLTRWEIGAGYGGGAGLAKLNHAFSVSEKVEAVWGLGHGQGNGYSVSLLDAAWVFVPNEVFYGLGIRLVEYSHTIRRVIGISGNLDAGRHFDLFVTVGRDFGGWRLQAAYGPALGLSCELNYKFFVSGY